MTTSYFGATKKLAGQRVVCIARGVPKWYTGEVAHELAPTYPMINLPEKEFRVAFQRILDQLDAHVVLNDLKDAVLLCWEKPGEFCHRRMVAEWIEKETGEKVPEWQGMAGGEVEVSDQKVENMEVEERPAAIQMSLFDFAGVA